MIKNYYNFLEQLSWRTVKRLRPQNKFSFKKLPKEDKTNSIIANHLKNNIPLMAARYGITELRLILNVEAIKTRTNVFKDSLLYLTGRKYQFWELNKNFKDRLCSWSGFFPNNEDQLFEKFSDLLIENSKDLDILGIMSETEFMIKTIPQNTYLTGFRKLEPWFYEEPWSYQLKGKKVLVIHPFEDSIRSQYNKRELLFENRKILPKFDLKTIKAVQTLADNKDSEYKDWFEALESMKIKIQQTDFDVAIIGCGAYGFPLASYVKKLGKQAIHLGGMVQWLFGIKGQRWLDFLGYKNMPNEHWIFPSEDEKPKGFEKVEGGCYW